MTSKNRIVEALGEPALLVPGLIADGLRANDQVKYLFSLAQAARDRAEHPEMAPPDLAAERRAASVEDESWDGVPAQSRRTDGGYVIPLARRLLDEVQAGVRAMIAPLAAAGGETAKPFEARLETLLRAAPALADDIVPAAFVGQLTAGHRGAGDSLHVLVMDLHKALNRLQASIAEETVEGAHVYNLDPEDRPLVQAFMRGLARTAPLRFGHPGLDTTATRIDGRLVVQNDIGTTDAHVLVLKVEGASATLTYTDVHRRRLRFFRSLFAAFPMRWEDGGARTTQGLEEDAYYVLIGRFEAADPEELRRYLAHLGSRIVFLIDWNRARRRLQEFVGKEDALALLGWAAEQEVGHRGFLELGGEHLIYEAVDHAAQGRLGYREPLHRALGREAANEYLRFVLKTCSDEMLRGRSQRLIRDEIKAELLSYFRTGHERLLALTARHAELIGDLASAVRDSLLRAARAAEADAVRRIAARAATWEREADETLNDARAMLRRGGEGQQLLRVLEEADDAADGLEEAAFLATLLPADRPAPGYYAPLQELGGLLLDGAREFIKCIESAAHVRRGGARQDVEDFLLAVDRLRDLEHAADDGVRRAKSAAYASSGDFRDLSLMLELARILEEATDSLARAAVLLREHILNDVMPA